jgi:hypothetical protein
LGESINGSKGGDDMFNFDDEAINLFEEIREEAKTNWAGCVKKIKVALRSAYVEGCLDENRKIQEVFLNSRKKEK